MEKQIRENRIVLGQILDMLNQLNQSDYVSPLDIFGGSSLGQHYRHIMEFYLLLIEGVQSGLVAYDKRIRKKEWEDQLTVAKIMFKEIDDALSLIGSDTDLMLEYGIGYENDKYSSEQIKTTLRRELIFVLEHSIHHLAMIKMGLRYVRPDLKIDPNVGVAPSTLNYHSNVHTDLST